MFKGQGFGPGGSDKDASIDKAAKEAKEKSGLGLSAEQQQKADKALNDMQGGGLGASAGAAKDHTGMPQGRSAKVAEEVAKAGDEQKKITEDRQERVNKEHNEYIAEVERETAKNQMGSMFSAPGAKAETSPPASTVAMASSAGARLQQHRAARSAPAPKQAPGQAKS